MATTFAYDQYANMIGRTLPDGESESYVYDQFGNELSHVDFNGNTSTYTYYTNYYSPSTGSGQGAYAQQLQRNRSANPIPHLMIARISLA